MNEPMRRSWNMALALAGFCLLVIFSTLAGAQEGAYISSEDMEEVLKPESQAQQGFLYRVGEKPDSLRFYKVTMSNLLYGSKKTFQWPTELDGAKRFRLPLFSTREAAAKGQLIFEILCNDRLVLSKSDSLFYQSGNAVIALKRIPPPGILLLTSPISATYQKVDAQGKLVEKALPVFHYTMSDSALVCYVKSESRITIPVDPYTAAGQFRTLDIIPPQFPTFKAHARTLMDLPSRVEVDSTGLRIVDSSMELLKKWNREDSVSVHSFMDSVKKQLALDLPRQRYETSEAFQKRMALHAQWNEGLLAQVVAWNRLEQVFLPIRQKLKMFEDYRSQQVAYLANEEFKRAQDFRTQLVRHHLWKRIFVSGCWTLGRNMDTYYANPSPSYLGGGGVRLEWSQKLLYKTSLLGWAEGSHSRWRFQESEQRVSAQQSLIAGLSVGIPLGVAPAGNYTLDTANGLILQVNIGPAVAYRNTDLVAPAYEKHGKDLAFGGAASLALYFSSMPFLVSFDYSYFKDHFGDLGLRFGLPIFRGGTK